MTYYAVSKPTTTAYVVTVGTSTWYVSPSFAIRTWLSLANQGLKTWAALKAAGLTTWKKLGASRWFVTFYYAVPEPSTTVYNVSVSSPTFYEVT